MKKKKKKKKVNKYNYNRCFKCNSERSYPSAGGYNQYIWNPACRVRIDLYFIK